MVVLGVVVTLKAVKADNVAADDDDMRIITHDTVVAILTIDRIATVTTDQNVTVVTAKDNVVGRAGGSGQRCKFKHRIVEYPHKALISQDQIGIQITLPHDIVLIRTADNLYPCKAGRIVVVQVPFAVLKVSARVYAQLKGIAADIAEDHNIGRNFGVKRIVFNKLSGKVGTAWVVQADVIAVD